MVKALAYSTKGRKQTYAKLKKQKAQRTITPAVYNERLAKLNQKEQDYREQQMTIAIFQADELKKAREEAQKQRELAFQEQVRKAQEEKRLKEELKKKALKVLTDARNRYKQKLTDVRLIQQGQPINRFGRNHLTKYVYDFQPEIEISDTIIEREGKYEVHITEANKNLNITEMLDKLADEILHKINHTHTGTTLITIRFNAQYFFSISSAKSSNSYTKQEIMEKIVKQNNKTIDSQTNIVINGVIYTYIAAQRWEGSCDTNTFHKKLGDLKIMSPKSTKSNCLFACIHHHLKQRLYAEATRKELGIPSDTPIRIEQLEMIAKHYKVRITLSGIDGSQMGVYNKECSNNVNIMLFIQDTTQKGHYVLIEGEVKHCDACGHNYIKKHKCNLRRQMWINRMSGRRNVIPSKIKRETPFDPENMIYFDLETFKPEESDSITPYCASWFANGQYYCEYGEDAWTKFVDFVMTQNDKILSAYNGAGFDFHFLMSEMLARGEHLDKCIINNGRILSFTFGQNIRCWDLCLFTLSSLKGACKDFGISADNTKTEFDHFKITSWADVHKYRDEVEPYVKRDVMGMKEVFEKFSAMVYELFGCHMTEYITLSAMSYSIWTNSIEHLLELPDTDKYKFIRQSLYGGRTYPQQREYTSKHYTDIMVAMDEPEKLKDIYKSMDDYIFNGDVSSLYPTAMVKYEYPVGTSKWVDEADIDIHNLKIGIYECEIECNKDLIVPILPEKTEAGGIAWNLMDKKGIYTSADLDNAVKYGYTIKRITKGLVWEGKGDVFTEYINKTYKLKVENDKNPVLRQVAKILMNALYGKMLERARFEEQKVCNNIGDVWKFQSQFNTTDVQFIKDKVVCIGTPANESVSDDRIRKPSQIGTFILSYSRTHMLEVMEAIEPGLRNHFFTYTDTDSLHIHASKLPGLQEKGWLKEGLGMLSDDAKGGRIFREINLAPKLYMYLCLMPNGDIKTIMKSKGIPQQYLSPHLFEDADTLVDEDKVVRMEHRLKKVGFGRNLQLAWRKYDAFSILSVDMERTFYKNMWFGMQFEDGKWFPKK